MVRFLPTICIIDCAHRDPHGAFRYRGADAHGLASPLSFSRVSSVPHVSVCPMVECHFVVASVYNGVTVTV